MYLARARARARPARVKRWASGPFPQGGVKIDHKGRARAVSVARPLDSMKSYWKTYENYAIGLILRESLTWIATNNGKHSKAAYESDSIYTMYQFWKREQKI